MPPCALGVSQTCHILDKTVRIREIKDSYCSFWQESEEQAALRGGPEAALFPFHCWSSPGSPATSPVSDSFMLECAPPWGYTRGVEDLVKEAILVISARF